MRTRWSFKARQVSKLVLRTSKTTLESDLNPGDTPLGTEMKPASFKLDEIH